MEKCDNKHILTTLTTYADESFASNKLREIVVVAQVTNGADLRWYHDIQRNIPSSVSEIKYSNIKSRWCQLGNDRKKAILNGIKQSLIIICDPVPYSKEVEEEIIIPAVGVSPSKWTVEFKNVISKHIVKWVNELLVLNSPIVKASYHLKGTSISVDNLTWKLKSPHNVKIFVGRSVAVYEELINNQKQKDIYERLGYNDRRFLIPSHIYAELIYESHKCNRIFDNGNATSIELLRNIRKDLTHNFPKESYFIMKNENGVVEECDSKLSPYIQVADIAAGFARDWYNEKDGIKKICDHFSAVVKNGKIIS